jgi:hypothetical protein
VRHRAYRQPNDHQHERDPSACGGATEDRPAAQATKQLARRPGREQDDYRTAQSEASEAQQTLGVAVVMRLFQLRAAEVVWRSDRRWLDEAAPRS